MSKKGGSTTMVQPAQPTPEEKRMEAVQANFAEQTAPNAFRLQQAGANMLWNNPGIVPVDYTSMGQTGANQAYGLQRQTSNLGQNIGGLIGMNQSLINQGNYNLHDLSNQNAYNQSNGQRGYNNIADQNSYNQSNGNYGFGALKKENNNNYSNGNYSLNNLSELSSNNSSNANGLFNGLFGQNSYNQANGQQGYNNLGNLNNYQMTNNANSMYDLTNGKLPQAYADNQAYAINRGMNTQFGNLLADKASNGIIGSSQMDSGIHGIGDNVANVLSQNYNQNMAQAAGLQNQNYSQQQQGYNNLANIAENRNQLAQQGLTNQSNISNNIVNSNQQNYQNQYGINNDRNQLTQQTYANDAGLLNNQNAFNQQGISNMFNTTEGRNQLAQQGYQNQAGIASEQSQLGQQNLSNQQNIYNAQGQNLEQQRGLLSMPMELMNSAQNASIDIPNKLLGMSRGEMANTSNLWQNMAQQRIASKPDVYQQPGNGGLFGGLLSGLGSYVGAGGKFK